MLRAVKKNRVLRIPDEKAAEYKKLGYTITDMTGKVIYEPEDIAKKAKILEAENAELREKLSELETENASLKAKLKESETIKPATKRSTKAAASK